MPELLSRDIVYMPPMSTWLASQWADWFHKDVPVPRLGRLSIFDALKRSGHPAILRMLYWEHFMGGRGRPPTRLPSPAGCTGGWCRRPRRSVCTPRQRRENNAEVPCRIAALIEAKIQAGGFRAMGSTLEFLRAVMNNLAVNDKPAQAIALSETARAMTVAMIDGWLEKYSSRGRLESWWDPVTAQENADFETHSNFCIRVVNAMADRAHTLSLGPLRRDRRHVTASAIGALGGPSVGRMTGAGRGARRGTRKRGSAWMRRRTQRRR